MKLSDLKIGDIVKRSFGPDSYRYILIQEIEDNVKNGRPGICGICIGGKNPQTDVGSTVWCYFSSIDCKVEIKEVA